MKLIYIELEANTEEVKGNPSLADALRDALVRANRTMNNADEREEDGEEEEE